MTKILKSLFGGRLFFGRKSGVPNHVRAAVKTELDAMRTRAAIERLSVSPHLMRDIGLDEWPGNKMTVWTAADRVRNGQNAPY